MCNDAVDTRTEADSSSGKLLQHDSFVCKCSSASAIFVRQVGKQDACLTRSRPGIGTGAMLLAPASLVWQELILHELAYR
jgi:hypothetical protein